MKALAVGLAVAGLGVGAWAPAARAQDRTLPGIRYEVLAAGPAGGAHPTRADTVMIRYVGRLSTSEIFSTSAQNGQGVSDFKVREVIPGMSAALQLMRVGDRWRVSIPAYLAYGAQGRRHAAGDRNLVRDVPPDAALVFEVELAGIAPGR